MSDDNSKRKLFITTRDSRAQLLQVPESETAVKRLLEEHWAQRLGIDVSKLGDSSPTESTCDVGTPSATVSGSDTQGGGDVTADHTTDDQSDQIVDHIKNDGDGPDTGPGIDIPTG